MKIVEFLKGISGLAQLILVIITIVYMWQTLLWASIAWIVTIGISFVCLVIVELKKEE